MQTSGMDRTNGKSLSGMDHLRQSIMDILSTPRGTRVMRREYGSNLFGLVDRPMNGALLVAIYGETAAALARWEPRLILKQTIADLTNYLNGQIILTVIGVYAPDGSEVSFDDVVVNLRGL